VLLDGSSFAVQEGQVPGGVTEILFSDEREETGWTRLALKSLANNFSATENRAAMGFGEGYVNQKLIFAAYYNFANGTGNPMTSKIADLVDAQISYLLEQCSSNLQDPYWKQVALVFQQFQGLVAGYQAAAPAEEQLSQAQLMAYQLQLELGDYAAATAGQLVSTDRAGRRVAKQQHPVLETSQGRRLLMGEHCSVLIKMSDDQTQLLAGHVTWSSFNTMLRSYKTYDYTAENLRVHFSGYPGLLVSGDDWFQVGANLLVTETTNEMFNTSAYVHMTSTTLPYWIRVQVANALATGGKTWHETFMRDNNGGYNNQWMVVDYSKFQAGSGMQDYTLTVGEQAPGVYEFADQTEHLRREKYWASYNVPFYPLIWRYSGYEPKYQKFGNAYSHDQCARAQIYRRDQGKVQTVEQLKKMQRYNRWQSDPLSLQDACRGISARCDLNDPYAKPNVTSLNGFAAFGAIDGKVTDQSLMASSVTHAVCGPTWDAQPIFAWTDTWSDVPCVECPRYYPFEWVQM